MKIERKYRCARCNNDKEFKSMVSLIEHGKQEHPIAAPHIRR